MGIATNQDVERIAQEIERYLHLHPNAADSVEGIAEWWLPRRRYVENTDLVQMALDMLIRRGCLEKICSCNGSYIYKYKKRQESFCDNGSTN